jgi:hypothetical protein
MTHVDKNESNHAQVELSQVSSPFSGICFPYLYPGMALEIDLFTEISLLRKVYQEPGKRA